MVAFLIVLALSVAALGVGLAAEVSFGAAIVGVGCLLAILARMEQARQQHRQVMAMLGERRAEGKLGDVAAVERA